MSYKLTCSPSSSHCSFTILSPLSRKQAFHLVNLVSLFLIRNHQDLAFPSSFPASPWTLFPSRQLSRLKRFSASVCFCQPIFWPTDVRHVNCSSFLATLITPSAQFPRQNHSCPSYCPQDSDRNPFTPRLLDDDCKMEMSMWLYFLSPWMASSSTFIYYSTPGHPTFHRSSSLHRFWWLVWGEMVLLILDQSSTLFTHILLHRRAVFHHHIHHSLGVSTVYLSGRNPKQRSLSFPNHHAVHAQTYLTLSSTPVHSLGSPHSWYSQRSCWLIVLFLFSEIQTLDPRYRSPSNTCPTVFSHNIQLTSQLANFSNSLGEAILDSLVLSTLSCSLYPKKSGHTLCTFTSPESASPSNWLQVFLVPQLPILLSPCCIPTIDLALDSMFLLQFFWISEVLQICFIQF